MSSNAKRINPSATSVAPAMLLLRCASISAVKRSLAVWKAPYASLRGVVIVSGSAWTPWSRISHSEAVRGLPALGDQHLPVKDRSGPGEIADVDLLVLHRSSERRVESGKRRERRTAGVAGTPVKRRRDQAKLQRDVERPLRC
jgi:hypothetical protein